MLLNVSLVKILVQILNNYFINLQIIPSDHSSIIMSKSDPWMQKHTEESENSRLDFIESINEQ